MSLDVMLYGPPEDQPCHECGHPRRIEPCVFDANITHNLGRMADAAGIYEPLWHPETAGIKTARDLIEPLRKGIALLKSDPPRFKAFDAANGWGLYVHFLPWLERYLAVCEQYPDATVRVSR